MITNAADLQHLAIVAFEIALLVHIAVTDIATRMITNRAVLALLILGLVSIFLRVLSPGSSPPSTSYGEFLLCLMIGAVMFLALFPFWIAGMVGAGDLKLLAVAPIVVGNNGLFAFAVLLFLFPAITTLLAGIKSVIEARSLEGLAGLRKKRVPFGPPIAGAMIGALLFRWAGQFFLTA